MLLEKNGQERVECALCQYPDSLRMITSEMSPISLISVQRPQINDGNLCTGDSNMHPKSPVDSTDRRTNNGTSTPAVSNGNKEAASGTATNSSSDTAPASPITGLQQMNRTI